MTTVTDDLKKRRRRRRIEAYAISFSILAALLTVAGTVTTGVQMASAPHAASATPAWLGAVVEKLGDRDAGWVTIGVADNVATVTGEAVSQEAKDLALGAAETLIQEAAPGTVVVDNVSIKGGPTAMGQALAALGPAPTVDDCNTAFARTLDGRAIGFDSGAATITAESARLLNALTGVAVRCRAFKIEVGGHTDLRGQAIPNQALSQARADAVRDYLSARGVPSDILNPVGYGMAQPKVNARNPDADAQNRRIEFKVTG